MTVSSAATFAGTRRSLRQRAAWRWHNDPKRELWLAWWIQIFFYQVFTVSFFLLTKVQPPAHPWWGPPQVQAWFSGNHSGLLIGFALIFVVTGMTAAQNALIAYSIRRMSVSRAYAYAYLILYSLSAVPGMLLMCIALTVGAMRPDRDPAILSWLFDFAFLSYVGTMGVFLIGSIVWMVAILLDQNRVFPKWFAYLNLCNALTEVVVSPAWIFHRGPFAWDGVIAWWIDMVVFGIYAFVSFAMLWQVIVREDFGTGPLPELSVARGRRSQRLANVA